MICTLVSKLDISLTNYFQPSKKMRTHFNTVYGYHVVKIPYLEANTVVASYLK